MTSKIWTQEEVNSTLWRACDTFRGKIDSSIYKDYVLVMLFIKYVSDIYKEHKEELLMKYDNNIEFVNRFMKNERFILNDKSTFQYIYDNRNQPNVGEIINKALAHIEEENKTKLRGVFKNIDFNSQSILGSTKERNAMLKNLLEDFRDLDLAPSRLIGVDVIGTAYEYMISNFASDAGKKGGEFFTPSEVSELLSRLVKPEENDRIYDPPYNTGSDFIYRDDFAQSREEYDEELGVYNEASDRLFRNTETNGRFHSDWCSMIYPRIVLARNLLSDDGVIFISIDDGEVTNLKKICDEVLGASNFVGAIIRKVMEGGKSDSTGLAIEHEYCLCYGKQGSFGIYKRTSEHLEHYNKKDKYFEERGYYYLKPLENGGLGYVPTLDYPIAGPNGVDIYPGDFYGDNGYRWVWGKEKFNRAIDLDMIEFTISQKDKSKYKVYYKIYEKVDTDGNPSVKTLPFPSLYLDGYTNRQAINDLKRVFDNIRVFDYPKPLSFLQELCRMASKDDAIVMDFFSGSAGLAQATMQLNAEDGGCRKFIMVQLPEVTDEASEAYKAGYKNICEIGKERIRRAGDKIKDDAGLTGQGLDIGFRVLKLDDTNMNDVYYAAGDYTQDMISMLQSNIKEDRTDMDLLFGCLLDWGLPLSLPHTQEEIEGFTVHTYNEGDLIACFEERITEKVVREIASRQPLRVVFRDSSFTSSPEKINVVEIFKLLAPNTTVRVI